jgi:hypothetical protein
MQWLVKKTLNVMKVEQERIVMSEPKPAPQREPQQQKEERKEPMKNLKPWEK